MIANLTKQYAEALSCAVQGKTVIEREQVVERFVQMLIESDHVYLGARILWELAELERERSTEHCTIRVVPGADIADFVPDVVRDAGAVLRIAPDTYTIEHDDTLVGGYELRTGGMRIDRSHKRILCDMYLNLITSE